ncbi:unnamed protein product [Peronospora destructor]|uniref:Uncharacterized protein n=1 Tax=Peronospora destructor TaxID=86335 RepID=A0AAV0URP5_9STRA|nr:unnamed protein product [Peronospora destructor]
MTLGGMPPLNNVEINAGAISDVVAAGASCNEILTAFASLDTEVEDITKSDGTLPLEFQCQYRRGKCLQPRTLKKNGLMHSYCEYHRQLSVRNQRTFDQKKRHQRQELEAEKAAKRLCCSRRPTSHYCVKGVESVKPQNEQVTHTQVPHSVVINLQQKVSTANTRPASKVTRC